MAQSHWLGVPGLPVGLGLTMEVVGFGLEIPAVLTPLIIIHHITETAVAEIVAAVETEVVAEMEEAIDDDPSA